MKRTLLLLSFLLAGYLSPAQTARLTGTGQPDLDGTYRLSGTRNGRNRYVKETDSVQYVIYCRREGTSSVWMLEDDRDRTYFAANADTAEPPAQGWDVGQAGTKLNPGFTLEIEAKPLNAATDGVPELRTIRLENKRDSARRIVVRAVSKGQEIVRSRTYQPFESYAYQFAVGTQVYLLTEGEGEVLMASGGKQTPGRLLLTVHRDDADQTYPLPD